MVNRARVSIRKVTSCVEYDFEYTQTPVDPLLQQKVYGVSNIYYVIANIADELIKEKEPARKEHENKNDTGELIKEKESDGKEHENKNGGESGNGGSSNVLNMKISKVEKTKICDHVEGCDEVLKTIPEIEQKHLRGICEYLVNKTNAATMELNNIAASLVDKTEDKEIKDEYSSCVEHFTLQKSFDQKIAKDFESGNFKGVHELAEEAFAEVSYCIDAGFQIAGMKADPLLEHKVDEAIKMYTLISNISNELNKEIGKKKCKNRKDKNGDKKNIKKNKHGGVDA